MNKSLSYLAILLILIWGCDSGLQSSDIGEFDFTEADKSEAYDLALWYSAELTPSHDQVMQQLEDLKKIRLEYGDLDPSIGLRFELPWVRNQVVVKFTDPAAEAVEEGTFNWTLLDESMRPDTVLRKPGQLNWALLGFDEDMNPWKLSEGFEMIPEVIYSEPNLLDRLGFTDFPIKVVVLNNGLGYLFTSGSSLGPYYYFRSIDRNISFIGSWDGQGGEAPAWFKYIRPAISDFSCHGAPADAACWD